MTVHSSITDCHVNIWEDKHLLPAFADLGYAPGAFPHAEQAANEVLSLPMFPELTAEQCEVVARAVRDLAAERLESKALASAA